MIKLTQILNTLLLTTGVFISAALAHENETHYERINLSVSETAQVENDIMVATLYAIEEGSDAIKLAAVVNKRIRDGLNLVKKYPAIKHQTNAYSSNPVYSSNKIKAWRVRQSLRLESKDMALMSDVLGKLQSDLALQSMQFTVSPENKNSQDEALIDRALQAFEKRALQVVKTLRRKSYKIVDMNISTSGVSGINPQYQMRAMSLESSNSAPAVSAGEQSFSVTVNAHIELE